MSDGIRRMMDRQQMFSALVDTVKPAIIEALERATMSCITCDHFDLPNECCKLNSQRPPAKIIAFGCECFQDEIPF